MPIDTQELRQRQHGLRERLGEILSASESEDRELTAEEEQEFDRVQDEYDGLEKRRTRLEAFWTPDDDDDSANGNGNPYRAVDASEVPADGVPTWLPTELRSAAAREEMKKGPLSFAEFNRLRRPVLAQDEDEYRWAFFRYMTVRDLRELVPDELRVLSKATAAAGANLVPTSFQRELIESLREFGVVRQIARVITTTTGDALQYPSVSSHGTASWVAESAAYPESDEAFGQFTLNAYKAGTLMRVSEELLTDSAFDLDAYVRSEFGQRIGVVENTAYTVGDGTGKPSGWNNNATVGVTAAAGNTTTIPADNLIDLVHSVTAPYRANGVFVMNDAAVKAVRKLKDTTNQYLWSPGLTANQPDTLLGYRLYTDPDVPAPGVSTRSVGFGDFGRGYVIRDVDGISFQRLVELYAANGQVGFRAYHRTEGKIVNTNAIKVFVHSAT